MNDPLYNHEVFGPEKGRGGRIGKSDEQLIQDLISIHNAENWLGMDDDDSSGGGLGPALRPPSGSSPPKDPTSGSGTQRAPPSGKKPRADTPDSAVDVNLSPGSSTSSSSDYQTDNVGAEHKSASRKIPGKSEEEKVTIATQTGIEEADRGFDVGKLSVDPHCYECKVKYRDPRPKDLVMFLHAWKYSVRKQQISLQC